MQYTLIEAGPASRADLAQLLGVSRATVSVLSRDLIKKGVLREAAADRDARRLGRPSILLELDATAGCFAGVVVEQDLCVLVLTDVRGAILGERHFAGAQQPGALADRIAAALAETLREITPSAPKVLGLSVALPGVVNHDLDTCLRSASLGWIDVPFARMLAELIGLPVSLENNANAATVGEKLFGRSRDLRDFSVITMGDGIGCGHYVGGKLFRGHAGGAGELAHCTIELDGVPCRCGKRGCLTTIASRQSMIDQARTDGLKVETLTAMEALAASGNGAAIRILHRAGAALGLAISHLIHINNPERVVIAALRDPLGVLFQTVIRQTIEAHVLPQLRALTEIRFDDVDSHFEARGAASIAAQLYLLGDGH
eukprot:gene2139-2176_t